MADVNLGEVVKIVLQVQRFTSVMAPELVEQLVQCLQEIDTGNFRYGKIELTVAPGQDGKGKITRVYQGKNFERET